MRTLFHENIICLLPFHSPQYPWLPSLVIMVNLTMNVIIRENYNLQVESEATVYHQVYLNLPYLVTEIYLNLEK